MAPQLAWIGLGGMGRGMCKNLVEKGNLTSPLIIYNRTSSRATSLASTLPPHSTTIAPTLSAAITSADIIFTCLSDDAAILTTISTACTLSLTSKLFVDCSTVHPSTTASLSAALSPHGAHFVACPVFGAPAMAAAGQLVCVLAGPRPDVDRVKPYTTGVLGRATIDFGDQPPQRATHLKIVGNTFVLNMVETLAEGHVLAGKSGLGSGNLHQFVELMFPGPYTAYSARLMGGDYCREEPLFGVDLARKDARHAMAMAEEAGVRLKAVEVADGHLEEVQRRMGARGDIVGIYGAVREESGLEFEM